MARAGDTFWHRESGSPKEHLYVVLCDPLPDGSVLLCNLTKWKNVPDGKQIIDIETGTVILKCGYETAWRTTMFLRLLMMPESAADALMAKPRAESSSITDEWLAKVRSASMKIKGTGPILSAQNRFYDSWK